MAPMLSRLQCVKYTSTRTLKGILLGMSSANDRRSCPKTLSLIGWADIENDLCASVEPVAWLSVTGCNHCRHGSIPPLNKMELTNQTKYIRHHFNHWLLEHVEITSVFANLILGYTFRKFGALVKLVSGECQMIQSMISQHWGDFASDFSAPGLRWDKIKSDEIIRYHKRPKGSFFNIFASLSI